MGNDVDVVVVGVYLYFLVLLMRWNLVIVWDFILLICDVIWGNGLIYKENVFQMYCVCIEVVSFGIWICGVRLNF